MKHKHSKAFRVTAPIGAAVFLLALLYGLGRLGLQPPGARYDGRMAHTLAAQPCWDNTPDTLIMQTKIYDVMARHMLEGGPERKLLFIGLDGALPQAAGLLAREPGALRDLAAQGGMWLSRTGGAVPGDQVTCTAPSWTSMFTGVWADRHQVYDNGDTLSPEVRTIFYLIQARGGRASFSFSWKPHGSVSYKHEAREYPEIFQTCKNDAGTLTSMLAAIEGGSDAVFGIFELPDSTGHATGFSIRMPRYMRAMERMQADAKALIEAAQERAALHGEDWLIIVASDHGGLGFAHKGISMMEMGTFFAANKAIF